MIHVNSLCIIFYLSFFIADICTCLLDKQSFAYNNSFYLLNETIIIIIAHAINNTALQLRNNSQIITQSDISRTSNKHRR